jgi:hypothetical protein
MVFRPVAIVASVLVALIGSAADRGKPVPAGDWGGDQVGLSVTERGARLELACAHGLVETAILVDEEGRFDVNGVFVREGPGPVREDDQGEPARFSGRVEQDVMTLTVEQTTRSRKIGTFTLEKGRSARIRKCQ